MRQIATVVFFIIALFLSSTQVEARQIHAFIVADTLSNLKESVKHDVKYMKQMVHVLGKTTNTQATAITLTNEKLTRRNLHRIIKDREVAPDDIVLFYYSGHGFRTMATKDIWPCIYLTGTNEGVDLNDIIQALLKKKAGTYLVLADCCNNLLTFKSPDGRFLKESKQLNRRMKQKGFQELFLDKRLLIVATSSTPGQLSWATQYGGLFTIALIDCINKELGEEEPHWDRLLRRVTDICARYQETQFQITPLF